MSEIKHAPLPWRVQKDGVTISQTTTPHGRVIARMHEVFMDREMREANADYIVRACNAYPALVAALVDAMGYLDWAKRVAQEKCNSDTIREVTDAISRLDTALALARGNHNTAPDGAEG